MTLREKQSKFGKMVAMLLCYLHMQGYEYTWGDAKRPDDCSYGHPKSLHKIKLAVDLNIFKDGVYLREGEDYNDLGEYWESIGGSWGGRFNDGNHFSLAHQGMV